jgi:hypothetical protein
MRTTINDALVELESKWKVPHGDAVRLAGVLVLAGVMSAEARQDQVGAQRRFQAEPPRDPPEYELVSIVREAEQAVS